MAVSNTGQKTTGPNPQKLPGVPGETGGRVIGTRNPYQGDGRKLGPATGKNAGAGTT